METEYTQERQRIVRQARCPHCQQLMPGSTPAAPAEMAIDGMHITANDPYVTFCGHPGCGKRLEDCTEHAAWRGETWRNRPPLL